MPTVGLQLGLTGAAGTHGPLLPFQMGPHTGQPGQQIAVLGQFHLELTFPGLGALGKNIQNQAGAVQDFHTQIFRQNPHLGGRKLIVKNGQVAVVSLNEKLQFLHLAVSDEGAGVRGGAVLEQPAHRLAAGSFYQCGQFVHRGLRRALSHGHAGGAQTGQHGPFSFAFDRVHNSSFF